MEINILMGKYMKLSKLLMVTYIIPIFNSLVELRVMSVIVESQSSQSKTLKFMQEFSFALNMCVNLRILLNLQVHWQVMKEMFPNLSLLIHI